MVLAPNHVVPGCYFIQAVHGFRLATQVGQEIGPVSRIERKYSAREIQRRRDFTRITL